jgi:hypothetical protein
MGTDQAAMQNTFEPYRESSSILDGGERLDSVLNEQGYLFFRGLIEKEKIDEARNEVRRVLMNHGYAVDDPDVEMRWSGQGHSGDDLASTGVVGRAISDLRSVTDVYQSEELDQIMRRIFDGEVFCWVENQDRVRVVISESAEVSDRAGSGQHVTTATPAHQDYYHFRVDFVTAWVPFVDTDLSTGGLALRKDSHKGGLYEHWFKDSIYLGVANTKQEDRDFVKNGSVVVGGESKPADDSATWLRSDYQVGDVLIFLPKMVHRGLGNSSEQIRVSADFRYQRKGAPTVWQSQCRMYECHAFLNEAREYLKSMNLESSLVDRAWEEMRFHGPREGCDIPAHATSVVEQLQAEND